MSKIMQNTLKYRKEYDYELRYPSQPCTMLFIKITNLCRVVFVNGF